MTDTRRYSLTDPVPDAVQKELGAYTPLLQQLLYNRGVREAHAAHAFLNPSYDTGLHDPFLLTDMDRAVTRILAAITKKERIVIYSDYDCDGIPGGVLLHDFFTEIGYEHFTNYIPHRHEEGYGFNEASIERFVTDGVKVIITVDCGIVDHAAAGAAQSQGIDVIVTDHHEPGETLPPAYAVVNPKRDTAYPFQGLCGTGVAYKVVLALIEKARETEAFSLPTGREKWLLDMVSIATIADMVPLVDENRVLARYGLTVLRKSRRPGLQHLLRKAGSSQQHLSEDDIGFTIGPRINAASRMDTPEDAFHMLRTRDEGEAFERVRHLEKLNNERKGVVAAMTKEAKRRLAKFEELPPVIVLGNPEWRPSLVGLVAHALVDTYARPAFLWGRDGKGVVKGSCRSDGVVSTFALMEHARDAFLDFGGHQEAGGFSVSDTGIHTLADALTKAHAAVCAADEALTPPILIDADIMLDMIDAELIRLLASLAPFGVGNPKPLFQFRDVTPEQVQVFGKAQNHTKLIFNTKHGRREAIAFFKTPEMFATRPQADTPCTLLAHIELSYFRGRSQTRLRIVDVV